MNILISIPDHVSDKLNEFCETKGMSRASLIRAMICKLVGEPVPPKKQAGRRASSQTQELE